MLRKRVPDVGSGDRKSSAADSLGPAREIKPGVRVCVAAAAAVALAGAVGAGALLRDGAAREAAAQAAVSRLDGARQLLVHRATRPT